MAVSTAEQLRPLLASSSDAVLIIDPDGRCVAASPAFHTLLGHGPDELAQLHLDDLVVLGADHADGSDGGSLRAGRWHGPLAIRHRNGSIASFDAWSTHLTLPPEDLLLLYLRGQTGRPAQRDPGAGWPVFIAPATEATIGLLLDGTVTSWNASAERLYGLSPDEIIGQPVTTLVPAEVSAEFSELLARVGRGERVTVHGMRHVNRDGSAIDVALGVSPVWDSDGAVVAAVALANEMSERLRAEEELQAAKRTARDARQAFRESEARFRGAFDAASIGMALVDAEGRFLQVNPALCGIVGYSEEELLARSFPEITHPDDLDTDVELARQLLSNEITTYQIEKNYLCKPGNVICGRLTVSLVRSPGGDPRYFVAQIQDITPFKAAGAALREAEERYRNVVEQMPAVVYVDAAGMLGAPMYVSPRHRHRRQPASARPRYGSVLRLRATPRRPP